LGAPLGNKATQPYRVPEWLLRAPLWQQRLYLAALFGAELSAPSTLRRHPATFHTPVLSVSKREPIALAQAGRFWRTFKRCWRVSAFAHAC
jgi:tRNA-splicing ligase RtcB